MKTRAICFSAVALASIFGWAAASGLVHGQSIRAGSTPSRISRTGAGNSHAPVFSANGRQVAFVSHANNLVTDDDLGPHLDLFLRYLDITNTVLVSANTNGVGGANDNIGLYSLSADARFVAFDTAANNLAPGDTNRASDVYVRSVLGSYTLLVSVNVAGTGSGNGPSFNPLISDDSRYIVFESLASNLVTNDFNGTNDIFVRDLITGTTTLVSLNSEGRASPSGPSFSPSISANGLFVAFVSRATNLVDGVTNRTGEIYVRDVAGQSNQWAVASHLFGTHSFLPASGLLGPYSASEPVLSTDGRYVAFKTSGQTVRFDLHRPTNSVFLSFTNNSSPNPSVNHFYFVDNPRVGAFASEAPLAFTPEGRFLAYSTRTNIVPNPGILRVDFESFQTNVIYYPPDGTSGGGAFVTNQGAVSEMVVTNFSLPNGQPSWVAISTNGARLFFLSDAADLVPSATNKTFQIYGVNAPAGLIQILSTNQTGSPGPDLGGVVPAIRADGVLVAWDSPDPGIVPDDLNRAWDVFARDLESGATHLVSVRREDLPVQTAIARTGLGPRSLSANGRFLAFIGVDNDVVDYDTNLLTDVFVRDLATGDVSAAGFAVTIGPPGTTNVNIPNRATSLPVISGDGRWVAYHGPQSLAFGSRTNIFLFDRLSGTNVLVNRLISGVDDSGAAFPSVSADGRLVAFQSAVTALSFDSAEPTDANGALDVFLRDFSAPNSPVRTISLTRAGTNTGSGASIFPTLSADARWIAFQSRATNLVEIPTTGASDQLFIHDRMTEANTLVSLRWIDPDIIAPMTGSAARAVFSADSRCIAFEERGAAATFIHHRVLEGSMPIIFANHVACTNCGSPSLDSDGRLIAYESWPVGGGPTNVFVKDIKTGQSEPISINFAGTGNGNGSSSTPLISHDARFVVFASKASDLVPNDNNGAMDIFVRDRLNGVTHCLSRNRDGSGTGNHLSSNPILSADGRTVAFQSFAGDLVAGDYNDTRDVFVVTLGGPDTDGDGMDDDWEMAYFNTLSRNGSGDFDGDGSSDLAEFRVGTNPSKDTSVLRVITLTTFGDQPTTGQRTTSVIWTAIPGHTYRVQFKNAVDEGWTDLPGDVVAASTSVSKSHTAEDSADQRFYRVIAVP